MSTSQAGSYFGSFYMVIAAICFTLMGILVKQANLKFGLHEYELVFWRMLVATIVLGGQALILKHSFKTSHPKPHFWRSLIGTISLFTFFYGFTRLPLATAITFSNTSAIFMAILSLVILKQKPSGLTWLSLVIGLVGVILILQPTLLAFGVVPTLIGLSSGLLAGYAYMQVRELSLLGEPSWLIVFYFAVVATILSGVVSTFKGWSALSLEVMPYLLGIGAFAMIGQLFMTHAYKVGRKFMVASLSYLAVVLSALYGVWGFGEHLSLMAMLGITLVIASGIVSGLKN